MGWVDGTRRAHVGEFLFESLLLALSFGSFLGIMGMGYLEERHGIAASLHKG